MLYVLNSLPNTIWGEKAVTVKTVTIQEVKDLLGGGFVSAVGHADFAEILSAQAGIEIPANRSQVLPDFQAGDRLLAGLVTPPRRLAEGERWSQEEILAMPIKWVMVG
jgi:hypothetical protein